MDKQAQKLIKIKDQETITKKLMRHLTDNALIIPVFDPPMAVMHQPWLHTTRYEQGFVRWQTEERGWRNIKASDERRLKRYRGGDRLSPHLSFDIAPGWSAQNLVSRVSSALENRASFASDVTLMLTPLEFSQ